MDYFGQKELFFVDTVGNGGKEGVFYKETQFSLSVWLL